MDGKSVAIFLLYKLLIERDIKVTATFDLPGVKKEDIHISYQVKRLVVTWRKVDVTEWEEDGRLIRECKESKESRTMPLPEGTKVSRPLSIAICRLENPPKFEEIHANMGHQRLVLTYPNMRSVRA